MPKNNENLKYAKEIAGLCTLKNVVIGIIHRFHISFCDTENYEREKKS